jgi:hypothetical protein
LTGDRVQGGCPQLPGIIRLWNRGAETIFGYREQDGRELLAVPSLEASARRADGPHEP